MTYDKTKEGISFLEHIEGFKKQDFSTNIRQ